MILLLFNKVGYHLFVYYMQERASARLEQQLDNNEYDASRLISIKVPVTHLVYYASTSQYERVDGKTEIGGVQYKFVKRRLFHDTLELMCIPDHKAIRQGTTRSDTYPGLLKNFSIDCYTVSDLFQLADPGIAFSKGSSSYFAHIPPIFLLAAEHPPQPGC